MKFLEFLNEHTYKLEGFDNIEEAKNIFYEKCGDMNINDPLWRGMRGTTRCYILSGEHGNRKSINTTNYYTYIIDHFIKKEGNGYPLRSNSIICATNPMRNNLGVYGPKTYAIFPYNNVKIGLLPTHDIWRLSSDEENKYRMLRLNNMYEEYGISDKSYEEFLSSLKEYINNYKEHEEDSMLDHIGNDLIDIFGTDANKVEDKLEELYGIDNLKIKFITNKDLKDIKNDKRELWISGKCLAIEKTIYEKMISKSESK